jgi:organic hydroperoxide reductase OsmC/OhrA
MAEHHYETTVSWSDPRGTADYRGYSRTHSVVSRGRPVLSGSADRAFRGDPERWNPELLLLAALSECHLLSYLSSCARAGVVVTGYRDTARGTMTQQGQGGRFTEVVLRPQVVVADVGMRAAALALHEEAHANCFIASSVSFPVRHEPSVEVGTADLVGGRA